MNGIRRSLTDFEFRDLFIEHLLWDSSKGSYTIEAAGNCYQLDAVAEKRGLVVLVCRPIEAGAFPGAPERKRIEREATKLHHEHVIVFVDQEQTRQIWQVPRREAGKTSGHSEIPYFKGKGVEHLARRIEALSFTLSESESVSLVEVAARVNRALLAERVTKKFFKDFSDHRKAFVKFLEWIDDEAKRDWYCSVLLNRLMFIYFLAEKGFLPGGKAFLSRCLEDNARANGTDTFYTHFLLPLSFFGFGERQGQRGRFEATFEGILYLDGGLFTVHQVERELGLNRDAVESAAFPAGARIPDAEFKRWFSYFDDWRWTLDEEKVENDGYISPHILGYIFEKYINQKQMGAYYTKEDITGYICRNTVVPRIFDMLAQSGTKGAKAVEPLPIGPHPNLLNDGLGISAGEGIDRYVYASVKQEEKLPTETDYEQAQRATRYEGILADFDAGKIHGIDDLIIYNLDIERLARDFVENIQDPDVLHAFYFHGLQRVTILDPTCGSGAFLFAALGILYPLYEAALKRMRYLVGKATGVQPDVANWRGELHFDDLDSGQGVFADQLAEPSQVIEKMKAEVERINEHPSAEYFIKKSIIVNNLFGVDIMEEAVEICKLRLFLTLIATVERDDSKPNFGVEPLPDIDFNILAGNTLVGYASIADIDRLWHVVEHGSQGTLSFYKDHSKLKELCAEYGKVLTAWRLQQLGEWSGARITKDQVFRAAEQVRPELDEDLWRLYRTAGLATRNEKGKSRDMTQAEFKRTHEPFHWLLEFPSIEAAGGFDVVVGNPPFLDLKGTKLVYAVIKAAFETHGCGNLYALCVDRCLPLAHIAGRFGMIMPVSAISTDGFEPLQQLFLSQKLAHIPSFDDRPAKLFDGLEHIRACIAVIRRGQEGGQIYTSNYNKWSQAERDHLFPNLVFAQSLGEVRGTIPKLSDEIERPILDKLAKMNRTVESYYALSGGESIYFARKVGYFLNIYDFVPTVRDSAGQIRMPSEFKELRLRDQHSAGAWVAVFNSSLFNWYFTVHSDCRHLNKRELEAFPLDLDLFEPNQLSQLLDLSGLLMKRLRATSQIRAMSAPSGRLEVECIYPRQAKDIIDEIDATLAEVIGLTPSELSFVRNYDIKYRLGQLGGQGDEP